MSDESAADALVARAIESVLGAVPAAPEEAPAGLEKYQPWADKASPAGRSKRPLQELLDELAARVAAEPEARAASLPGKPPGEAWFDRFGSRREGGETRGRRRRRGRGGAAEPVSPAPHPASAAPPRQRGRAGRGGTEAEAGPSEAGRRRRRRRGRGGPRGGGGGEGAAPG